MEILLSRGAITGRKNRARYLRNGESPCERYVRIIIQRSERIIIKRARAYNAAWRRTQREGVFRVVPKTHFKFILCVIAYVRCRSAVLSLRILNRFPPVTQAAEIRRSIESISIRREKHSRLRSRSRRGTGTIVYRVKLCF